MPAKNSTHRVIWLGLLAHEIDHALNPNTSCRIGEIKAYQTQIDFLKNTGEVQLDRQTGEEEFEYQKKNSNKYKHCE